MDLRVALEIAARKNAFNFSIASHLINMTTCVLLQSTPASTEAATFLEY